MFGGWRTAFVLGYSLLLPGILSVSPGDESLQMLNLTFGSLLTGAYTETMDMHLSLPKGAYDVSFQSDSSEVLEKVPCDGSCSDKGQATLHLRRRNPALSITLL